MAVDTKANDFYMYAMELFLKSGHVTTSSPLFCNHSSTEFVYFDNQNDVSFSREQIKNLALFSNVSHLFSANNCAFFSVELPYGSYNRSRLVHDIHSMIHLCVREKASICIFINCDMVVMSFIGFGYKCMLSDWYSVNDPYETLLNRLDISNYSIGRGIEYYRDFLYMLARQYYHEQPSTLDLVPYNYFSSSYENDRASLNLLVEEELNKAIRDYGDDYIGYDDSQSQIAKSVSNELDILLLELDEENFDNVNEEEEVEKALENDVDQVQDEYELDYLSPELFRDPTLLVKWIERETNSTESESNNHPSETKTASLSSFNREVLATSIVDVSERVSVDEKANNQGTEDIKVFFEINGFETRDMRRLGGYLTVKGTEAQLAPYIKTASVIYGAISGYFLNDSAIAPGNPVWITKFSGNKTMNIAISDIRLKERSSLKSFFEANSFRTKDLRHLGGYLAVSCSDRDLDPYIEIAHALFGDFHGNYLSASVVIEGSPVWVTNSPK